MNINQKQKLRAAKELADGKMPFNGLPVNLDGIVDQVSEADLNAEVSKVSEVKYQRAAVAAM